MDKVLKDIFRKNPYFKEINENSFIPQYSELIINGVVLHKVNWIIFMDKELLFMNEDNQNIPISSINLENLNSIMIHTIEGIKEVLYFFFYFIINFSYTIVCIYNIPFISNFF